MKKMILVLMLLILPGAAFALEQSFTQQGLTATIKLSPDKLEAEAKVQLSLNLSKDGAPLVERDVTLEVYERNADLPIILHHVDVLDGDYVDSWKFEKAGDYRVVLKIAEKQKPAEMIRYEINATVMEAGGEHADHGFMGHHMGGGNRGWWGMGAMLIIMVPMMILML